MRVDINSKIWLLWFLTIPGLSSVSCSRNEPETTVAERPVSAFAPSNSSCAPVHITPERRTNVARLAVDTGVVVSTVKDMGVLLDSGLNGSMDPQTISKYTTYDELLKLAAWDRSSNRLEYAMCLLAKATTGSQSNVARTIIANSLYAQHRYDEAMRHLALTEDDVSSKRNENHTYQRKQLISKIAYEQFDYQEALNQCEEIINSRFVYPQTKTFKLNAALRAAEASLMVGDERGASNFFAYVRNTEDEEGLYYPHIVLAERALKDLTRYALQLKTREEHRREKGPPEN